MCGVSTQIQQRVVNFDELIAPSDPEFGNTGLKAASVIRLGFLGVLPQIGIPGIIGSIARERHHRLLTNLCRHLSP